MSAKTSLLSLLLFLHLIAGNISAQEEMTLPGITISPQVIHANTVLIDEIEAINFGFIVIRNDDGTGQPGGVIGLELLRPGVTRNLEIRVEMINLTPKLFAIVHIDTEPYGNFQFGEVDGADLPVTVNDDIVMADFEVVALSVHDQFLDPDNFNRIVLDTVASAEDAWVVVHADKNGAPGEVLGHTFLEAGISQNLPVLLQGDVTDTLHAVLHLDTGEPERYEFDEDESVDAPFELNGTIASTSFSSIPLVRLNDGIVIGSDLTRNNNEFVPFLIDSVLSDGAGWLVVQADDGTGIAGEVIGVAPVQHGYNANVIVEVPQEDITAQLFATLHQDTGEALVFEYETVDEVDLPASINDSLIQANAYVIPSIRDDFSINEGGLLIHSALIDTAGWLVMTAESGDILAYAPLNQGLNRNIQLDIDPAILPDSLSLQLHYDTRLPGVFGFPDSEGSDLPVVFAGEPIILELMLTQ